MKGSLPAQLKMALFGAGEDDHVFATRRSAASPRSQRAKQYDAIERQLRARAQAFAQFAADRLADDNPTMDDDDEDAGLFTVPPESTDPIEPEDTPDTTSEPSATSLEDRIPNI